jgi:hypothetical protein
VIESNKVFKLNQELWFGYKNLCEEQTTTLNTGVAETQLQYTLQRKYLTMLGIYTVKYGGYKLSNEFYGRLQNIYDKVYKNDYILMLRD